MFMFSHYTLNAFSPRVFIRYKRHACLMAVLLFICGACCLAWPLVAGWYLATVTGMLLMDVKPANKAALAGIFLSACWIYLSPACGWP